MPTGYTADLYDGKSTSARDFLLKCATAFDYESGRNGGDLAPGDPRTEYQDESIAKHEARIAEINAWTDADADREAQEAYDAAAKRVRSEREKYAAIRDRYKAVLTEIEAWEAPTELHVGMRDFAIKQLRDSLDFDTASYLKDPVRKSGAVHRADELAAAGKSLSYAREDRAKTIKRTEERNQWVQALLDSLPAEVTA